MASDSNAPQTRPRTRQRGSDPTGQRPCRTPPREEAPEPPNTETRLFRRKPGVGWRCAWPGGEAQAEGDQNEGTQCAQERAGLVPTFWVVPGRSFQQILDPSPETLVLRFLPTSHPCIRKVSSCSSLFPALLVQTRERTCLSTPSVCPPTPTPASQVHSAWLWWHLFLGGAGGTGCASVLYPTFWDAQQALLPLGGSSPVRGWRALWAAQATALLCFGPFEPEDMKPKAGEKEFLYKDRQRHSESRSWDITESSAGDKCMGILRTSG